MSHHHQTIPLFECGVTLSPQLMQSFKIMDYSLLVGVHNVEQASLERNSQVAEAGPSCGATDSRRPAGQKPLYNTAIEAIQGEAGGMASLDTQDQ